jgi:16S rRNA (uracil1498-N3)-methyltransferase
MSRPPVRLYCDVPRLSADMAISLPKDSAHYIGTVMRASEGDIIEIFNGRDGAWRAEITQSSRNRVELLVRTQSTPQEVPDDIWLCAAPLKKARIDWLVEKACELGVARFQPVITRRTIVDKLNLERLASHCREAAEQCGRTSIPLLQEPMPLPKMLQHWPSDRTLLFCDETGGTDLADAMTPLAASPLAVLIGPEGGFDDEERALLLAHAGTRAVSLGPRVLRADTAAVSALSVIQALTGSWKR